MKRNQSSLRQIETSQRDLWIVSSVVLLALSGGFAMLWPAVQDAARERLGTEVSARALLMGQLALVCFLILYLWTKGAQIYGLTRRLAMQRGRTEGLEIRLDTVRSLLHATAEITVDQGAHTGLAKVLEELTTALQGDRAVLHRVSADGMLVRDAVYPAPSKEQAPSLLALEDEVAERVLASGEIVGIGKESGDPQSFRGGKGPAAGSLVAAPVLLDGELVGVLSVHNTEAMSAEEMTDEDRELLSLFASFAAGVVRNFRLFQNVADKNAELDRAHRELRRAQSDLAEVDAATTLACVASTMAHSLSGPLTSMRGYVDVLRQVEPRSRDALRARTGIEREFFTFRDRLQSILDTLAQLRTRYELVDLDEIVQEAARTWRDQNHDSPVEITVAPYGNLPLTVVDSLRMRQVLLSVLRHAGRTAASTADRTLQVATVPEAGRIHLSFRFAGGTDAAMRLHELLEPRVRLEELRRAEGLDLAVACGIIRQHCGEVTLEAANDRLELRIAVPVRRDAPTPAQRIFPVSCGLEEGSAEEVMQQILRAGDGAAPVEPMEPVEPQAVAESPLLNIDTSGLFGPGDVWSPSAPGEGPPVPAPPPERKRREEEVSSASGDVARALSFLDDLEAR